MKITKKWLEGKEACQEGMAFVEEKELIGLEGTEFVKKLMDYEQYEYANWLIVRIMDREQRVKYANFSADLAKKWAERAADYTESAAYCAERAADWAENAAYWTARAAYWAENAAYWAENAAMAAYWAENAAMAAYKEILSYGLKLLEVS